MMDFNSMGKDALRAACKAAGIAYGKLNNDGMRAALAAKQAPAPTASVVPVVVPKEERAAQEAAQEAAQPTKVRTIEKNREEQNGIKRPSAGTLCRAVWDALDKLGIETATSKHAKELAVKKGWNPNNVSIEFYQWRRFNGVTGRQAKK